MKNRVTDFRFIYVNMKCNLADILSRGTTVKNLSNNILWHQGPEWLNKTSVWPEQTLCAVSTINNEVSVEKIEKVQSLTDTTKFSSLGKLLRVTEYVSKFIRNTFVTRGSSKDMNTTTQWRSGYNKCKGKAFLQNLECYMYHQKTSLIATFLSHLQRPSDKINSLKTSGYLLTMTCRDRRQRQNK